MKQEDVLPEGFKRTFTIKKIQGDTEFTIDDNHISQLIAHDYFFILYDYLPKTMHNQFVDKSLTL